jgi:hypothetical protein
VNRTSAQGWTWEGSHFGFKTNTNNWIKVWDEIQAHFPGIAMYLLLICKSNCASQFSPQLSFLEVSVSGTGLIAIGLARIVTVNAGQRQALYVTVVLTLDRAYIRYGLNYMGNKNNTIVAQDSNSLCTRAPALGPNCPPVPPASLLERGN